MATVSLDMLKVQEVNLETVDIGDQSLIAAAEMAPEGRHVVEDDLVVTSIYKATRPGRTTVIVSEYSRLDRERSSVSIGINNSPNAVHPITAHSSVWNVRKGEVSEEQEVHGDIIESQDGRQKDAVAAEVAKLAIADRVEGAVAAISRSQSKIDQ